MRCSAPINMQHYNGTPYQVPCGQCMPCRVNRQTDWMVRIMHEANQHDHNYFCTLTYDDDHLPDGGSLVKRDCQLFLKRVRKYFGKFRYFLSGEYGDKFGRPHYHAIFFGLDLSDRKFQKKLEEIWEKGTIHVGELNPTTARYTAKYTLKTLMGHHRLQYDALKKSREFALMSRRPGLGFGLRDTYADLWANNGYCVIDGVKQRVPVAYTRYLPEETRKKITQKKLDYNNQRDDNICYERSIERHQKSDEGRMQSKQSHIDLEKKIKIMRGEL